MSAATSSNDPLLCAIRHALSGLLPDRPNRVCIRPLPGGEARGHTVWKVTTPTGACLAVKQQTFAPLTRNRPYDLLEVEKTVCRLLRAEGCPLPEVYATEPEYSLIFFEWCGRLTLDDICQEATPPVRSSFADRTVDGFAAVQAAFQTHTPALSQRAFPGCDPKGLLESWQEATDGLERALPHLVAHFNPASTPQAVAHRLWPALVADLEAAPPTLGTTDYNARNVVVNPEPEDLTFIEFSKLGWDWPERRLVQYTTGLGAGRPDGRFRSLLTPRTTARYTDRAANGRSATPEAIARRLDGHHLTFHLLAGCRLLAAASAPTEGRNPGLLNAWRNPERRLKQLQRILATPLSGNPAICELRSLFGAP